MGFRLISQPRKFSSAQWYGEGGNGRRRAAHTARDERSSDAWGHINYRHVPKTNHPRRNRLCQPAIMSRLCADFLRLSLSPFPHIETISPPLRLFPVFWPFSPSRVFSRSTPLSLPATVVGCRKFQTRRYNFRRD